MTCYAGTQSMLGSNREFQKCPSTCQDSVLEPFLFCWTTSLHIVLVSKYFSKNVNTEQSRLSGRGGGCFDFQLCWKIKYGFLKPTKTDLISSNFHFLYPSVIVIRSAMLCPLSLGLYAVWLTISHETTRTVHWLPEFHCNTAETKDMLLLFTISQHIHDIWVKTEKLELFQKKNKWVIVFFSPRRSNVAGEQHPAGAACHLVDKLHMHICVHNWRPHHHTHKNPGNYSYRNSTSESP